MVMLDLRLYMYRSRRQRSRIRIAWEILLSGTRRVGRRPRIRVRRELTRIRVGRKLTRTRVGRMIVGIGILGRRRLEVGVIDYTGSAKSDHFLLLAAANVRAGRSKGRMPEPVES